MNRRDFFWNMIGSMVYAVTSMLLGAAVNRILGADAGGYFLFAFTTIGQHMFIVSYFGLRPVQVTDTGMRSTFGEYRSFRLITCGAAFVFSALFAVFYAGTGLKAWVIILMCLYKILDGFADCYESEFQRDGRLDLTGKSLTFRTLLAAVSFILAMIVSRNLLVSCVAAVTALAVAMALGCELPLRAMNAPHSPDFSVRPGAVKKVFDEGKWLFLSAFADLYVLFASKYAIDVSQDAAVSGYYSLLFIPASFVNLLANFIIRPVLTSLAQAYENRHYDEMKKSAGKITAVIALITGAGNIAAYFLGIPVLALVAGPQSGEALRPYAWVLTVIITGGGFYAVLNLFYYLMVILKKQKIIFVIYAISAVIATTLCFPLAAKYSISGAAAAYLICTFLTAAMFVAAVLSDRVFRKTNPGKTDRM